MIGTEGPVFHVIDHNEKEVLSGFGKFQICGELIFLIRIESNDLVLVQFHIGKHDRITEEKTEVVFVTGKVFDFHFGFPIYLILK